MSGGTRAEEAAEHHGQRGEYDEKRDRRISYAVAGEREERQNQRAGDRWCPQSGRSAKTSPHGERDQREYGCCHGVPR